MLQKFIRFFLEQKVITFSLFAILVTWGLVTAPFDWDISFLPRDPVPVDAIPDIGENQQIVYTEWMGRSPQDVEDQITYPLSSTLLGLAGVKSIRSSSMFGFSTIYLVFEDDVDYYWSRSRILEKLNALPPDLLPESIQPRLGPDATALGQVFWYTLEGRDEDGNPVGGWELHELRSIQDYYIRYALSAVPGVAEVASVGGHIREYQVELNPVAMRGHGISLMQVMDALRKSNQDVGANTMEVNQVEYYIRGRGYVESLEDIEEVVLKRSANVPIRVKDIATVQLGPADRSMLGILDKSGAEATGGVVVARYGDNPMKVIQEIKAKIKEISPGLPSKELEDGRVSQVTLVPFYDRSHLISETLATLYDAISLQILITILVIIIMVYHLRTSILIASLLPLAVLICFILMRYLNVEANIVALSGIAIAIGTMVDLGIILNENILRRLEEKAGQEPLLESIAKATQEVSTAIITAVATTLISFLPVFTLQAAEGKLFSPLAWTKTFALLAALIFTLVFMPAFAHSLLGWKIKKKLFRKILNLILLGFSLVLLFWELWAGLFLLGIAIINLGKIFEIPYLSRHSKIATLGLILIAVSWLLAYYWMPLGAEQALILHWFFIVLLLVVVLGSFWLFILYYTRILRFLLEYKKSFLILPLFLILWALFIWQGSSRILSPIQSALKPLGLHLEETSGYQSLAKTFPGLGKEFMPALDEGAFLLMPTSMPHSGVEANKKILQQLDMLVTAIPEVESVVGKAGRAETALDPAPLSMFENVILYKSEYLSDDQGRKLRFKKNKDGYFILKRKDLIQLDAVFERSSTWLYDQEKQEILNQEGKSLEKLTTELSPANSLRLKERIGDFFVPDKKGDYFRQWRESIKSPDDIWQEIVKVSQVPGVTSAPKLQPIETRLVMLQTGMRAPMGIKVYGPDLEGIEAFSKQLEKHLKEVPSVKSQAVFADISLGKPYMEVSWDREALAQYGISIGDAQESLEVAFGGMELSKTVEGRERYAIRARYARAFRSQPENLDELYISQAGGGQVPLKQVAEVKFRIGPTMIKGEDSFLVSYVLFDRKPGMAEVAVVEEARDHLEKLIRDGSLKVPPGISYRFSGSYENQVRAEKRLSWVVPLSLMIIFLILYLQFRSTLTATFIFSAIALAFAGGFIMLWLYGQDWFLNFSLFGTQLRDFFQIQNIHLSVAVWVGFIALFGIATDDGVVMATYLKQQFSSQSMQSIQDIRAAVVEAGERRVRPCLMTTATTLLALLPVLSSSGRGSDIMIPMAIPAFGGMSIALITLFVIPVLYAWREEIKFKKHGSENE